ncbi:hypothetical protein T06_1771 [Trichinella sp. T6]|nr:hypothetical protein T06_1771 [Trichinella sp. T6]
MLLFIKLLQRSVYSSGRCEFEPISSLLLCCVVVTNSTLLYNSGTFRLPETILRPSAERQSVDSRAQKEEHALTNLVVRFVCHVDGEHGTCST